MNQLFGAGLASPPAAEFAVPKPVRQRNWQRNLSTGPKSDYVARNGHLTIDKTARLI
jgi:hypothetical protein